MQEILHAFGIDWKLIVIQIFNFSILMGVLWYFLYTPVLKIISDREEKIKKGLDDADLATQALKKANDEKDQIIKTAHTEASHIVQRGVIHAEEKAKNIATDAAEKVVRQLEAARVQAEEEKKRVIKESEDEVARLAILGAEKVLLKSVNK